MEVIKKIIIVILIGIVFIGCDRKSILKEKKEKYVYTYTIWVGSASISIGHSTDTFNIDNNLLVCEVDSQTVMFPMTSVYKIVKEK